MRTDFDALNDGDRITLHPRPDNPLYKRPHVATYQGGYFYADKSRPEDGPDYYMGDVLTYNEGFSDG